MRPGVAFLCALASLPQLRRERKAPRAAAGAAHADEDRLLLLLAEVGAVQHLRGLLLEQVVQRQIAGEDAVVGRERGLIGRRRRGDLGLARRLGCFDFRHRALKSSNAGLTRVSMLTIGT
jgi:hypothetical protein